MSTRDEQRLWQEEHAKLNGTSAVELLRDILAEQHKTNERIVQSEQTIATLIKEAFPGGDTDGHRRYHETQMERVAELRRLRAAIVEKSLSGMVWAGLIVLGLALWGYFKKALGLLS